ncbi:hypothetical protein P8605_38640, partial [Streptomyces sp. T-3]|nr:hypothetical protein [Streptomyces sp. T-3]
MPDRSRNHALAALLTEVDWTSARLARAVNVLGAAQGLNLRYDRTSVAHWLSGTRPRRRVAEVVAQAFSQAAGRHVSAEETGLTQMSPGQRDTLQAVLVQSDPVRRLLALCQADADPQLRIELMGTLYTLLPVPDPRQLETVPQQRRPPPADTERVRAMVPLFASLTERFGGAHGRPPLAAYLADMLRFRPASGTSPHWHTDLLAAVAQLTHLLGDMSADSGHPGLAQRYFRAACDLSEAAGDRRTHAITLGAISRQAHELGHRRYALDLADSALAMAGRTAPAGVLCYLLAGRAAVRAADRARCGAL